MLGYGLILGYGSGTIKILRVSIGDPNNIVLYNTSLHSSAFLFLSSATQIKIWDINKYDKDRELDNGKQKTKLRHVHLRLINLITTHLPVAGCSTITQMCFLSGFDDKKQERKAQD